VNGIKQANHVRFRSNLLQPVIATRVNRLVRREIQLLMKLRDRLFRSRYVIAA
jgi:hypothetical protein